MQLHSDDLDLSGLFRDLVRARREVAVARSRLPTSTPVGLATARHSLVLALRAYTDELDTTGTPVPYRLRSELKLYEALDPPQ